MRILAVSLASVLLTCVSVRAAVLRVCPDDPGDHVSLRAAVEAAESGDVIELCDGIFAGPDNVQIEIVGKDLTFRSQHGPEATVFFASIWDSVYGEYHPYRVFHIVSSNVRIEGITIKRSGTYADGSPDGGAILCEGGSLDLVRVNVPQGYPNIRARWGGAVALFGGSLSASDCVIGCVARDRGGAIYAEGGAVTLTRCVFDGSASCGGGAVWLEGGVIEDCSFVGGSAAYNCDQNPGGLAVVAGGSGDVQIVRCHFANRHDTGGAGVRRCASYRTVPRRHGVHTSAATGHMLIEDCVFEDCSSFAGACVSVGNATIRRTVFRRNYASFGGAADLRIGDGTIQECRFESSHGGPNGSPGCAVEVGSGRVAISASTFVGAIGEPAILVDSGASLDMDHTIIAFGTSGSSAVSCVDAASEVAVHCTDIFGNAGGDWVGCLAGLEGRDGNLAVDPLFCDGEVGDFHLRVSSPCAPPQSGDCGLIGALGVGCGTTALRPTSWGEVKVLYR